MATDLADIDKVMKRIAKNLPKVIDRETRRIATEIGEAAIDATPVKSGNLVNNWGITDGRPNPTTHVLRVTVRRPRIDSLMI